MFSCWIIHWNSNVTVSVPVGIRQKMYSDHIQNCIMGSVSRNLTLLTYVETIQTAEKQNIVIQHLNFSKVLKIIVILPKVSLEIFPMKFSEWNFQKSSCWKITFQNQTAEKFLLFLSFFNILELTNSSFLGHVELRNTRNESFTGGGDDSLFEKKVVEKRGKVSDLWKQIFFSACFWESKWRCELTNEKTGLISGTTLSDYLYSLNVHSSIF